MDLNSILKKLLIISKLNNFNNNNLMKCEKVFNKVNPNYKWNKNHNNCVKFSVECNDFDVNEDKQRQCYKQLKCFWPKCRYITKIFDNLNQHISHHLNKRQFVCEECDKQFHQISGLNNHKRYFHSNERHFVCQQNDCKKTFKRNIHLTRHKSRHSSVKSFGCNKCDKRFKINYDLIKHKKTIHSNIRPFVCPQSDCNKSFKRREHLNGYKRIHCSDKPFECEECNQRFKYKSNLNTHKIRFHSDIKPHKCFHNNCDISFVFLAELKTHIAYKHSTNRPYKCNLHNCNSTFKSSSNLNYHKKSVHLKRKK